MLKLLPRIGNPVLTVQEFNQVSLPDITQVMATVAGWFEGKSSHTE